MRLDVSRMEPRRRKPAVMIYAFSMTIAASHTLRTLGNSDLQITPIGLGAWAIGGGDWKYGWGPQDDNDSIAAIHRALDLGINWIDTAAVYGLGHSEEIVGRAVKSSAHKPYIFTKCSRLWNADGSIYSNLNPASLTERVACLVAPAAGGDRRFVSIPLARSR